MKIVFEPKAYKIVKGTILLLAVVLMAYVAYAAVSLTVSNTSTVTTSTGANLFLSPSQTSTTVCTSSTTGYSESPTIGWGSVSQLSTADQYACLENTGVTHALVVGTTFSSADGTLNIYSGGTGTTPLNGASIAANGFILVHLNWVVSSTAPVGSTNFNVNIA